MHLIELTADTWLSWDGVDHCETWDPETALKYDDDVEARLIMELAEFCQDFPDREVVEHAE